MPYIDKDKLIKELSTMYKSPTSVEDFMTVGYDHAIADVVVTVHEQPTADVVERKVGKWIKAGRRGVVTYSPAYAECSCCHAEPTFLGWTMRYCPNCGAEMKGEDDD